MSRRITRLQARLHQSNGVKEKRKTTTGTGEKLPAHFTNAVYDEVTGKIIDYRKLINHNKKET